MEKYALKDEDGNVTEDEVWPPGKKTDLFTSFVQDIMFMIHKKKEDPNAENNQQQGAYHLAEFTSRSAKVLIFSESFRFLDQCCLLANRVAWNYLYHCQSES